jgi:hypothetical protein
MQLLPLQVQAMTNFVAHIRSAATKLLRKEQLPFALWPVVRKKYIPHASTITYVKAVLILR